MIIILKKSCGQETSCLVTQRSPKYRMQRCEIQDNVVKKIKKRQLAKWENKYLPKACVFNSPSHWMKFQKTYLMLLHSVHALNVIFFWFCNQLWYWGVSYYSCLVFLLDIACRYLCFKNQRQIFNISRTKSHNLNVSRLVLQLPLCNYWS